MKSKVDPEDHEAVVIGASLFHIVPRKDSRSGCPFSLPSRRECAGEQDQHGLCDRRRRPASSSLSATPGRIGIRAEGQTVTHLCAPPRQIFGSTSTSRDRWGSISVTVRGHTVFHARLVRR